MQFAVGHQQTSHLVSGIFRKLPAGERKLIEDEIAAVTDTDLTTAVRPFMFGGKIVHELYFDPAKLLFFTREEKVGAIVSAFAISYLAKSGDAPLSDQSLRTHAEQIIQYGKRLKCGGEVARFLRRLRSLEDEWRRDSSADLSEQAD